MLEMTTSLGRSGLQDWLIQRVSAVILGSYFLFLLFFFIHHMPLQYETWVSLFAHAWMRYVHLLVLLALLAHAWIGVWTVTTDYLKPVMLRFPIQVFIVLGILYTLFWGVNIFWSIK